MASSKDRQRALARAKLDRQMARRAARERRRRRIQAGVGAGLAVLVILAGVAWLGGLFDGDDDTATDPAAQDVCLWTPQSAESNTELKDVGTPPTKDIPVSGTRPMTVTTNQGPITVSLDLTNAPCSAANLNHLASKKFYDNTECHEITAFGALRCGDPSGTGRGGPTYSFVSENVPTAPAVYATGTVALISDPPGQNGSQFLVFLKDYKPTGEAQYPIVGSVTAGADTLAKISKIPTVDNDAGDKVKPTDKIVVQTLTVGEAVADAPAPQPSASGPAQS
ncbi:MAG TPA: peptidylprolyl isomerase [Actinoplanes sp.]|nr:peptidylprolyl isomerase [Actinoplanes sp.]